MRRSRLRTRSSSGWQTVQQARAAGRVTGDGRAVTPDSTLVVSAALALDGRRMAYGLRGIGAPTWEFWIEDLLTGDKRQWARDQARRGIPRWSPDGTRLAYQWARPEGRGEEGTVAVRPTEAGEEQLLSGPLKVLVLPFGWSPDGQSVLVSSTTSTGKTAIAWMLDGMDK